MVGVRRALS